MNISYGNYTAAPTVGGKATINPTNDPSGYPGYSAPSSASSNSSKGSIASTGSSSVIPTGTPSSSSNTAAPTYSPTVITDANTRESTIPGLIAGAQSAGVGKPAGSTNGATGVNTPTTPVNATGWTDYASIYDSILNSNNAAGPTPEEQGELNLINSMKVNADANYAAQLAGVSATYASRSQLLQQSQQSRQAQVAHAMLLNGSLQGAPITSNNILTAQENADILSLNDLTNQETAAKADVAKAQADQDFQYMSKSLDLLDKIRTEKMTQAQNIVSNMKDYNDYLLNVQKFNETSANDAATRENQAQQIAQGKYEFRDLKDDLGNTIGTQVFDKSTGKPISNFSVPGSGTAAPGSNGVLMPVSTGADGKPDPAQQTQFLNTLPPPIRALVSGLISYRGQPPNSRSAAGQKLISLAEQADPTFDSANWQARADYLKNLDSGTLSQGILSANKVINHLSSFINTVGTIDNQTGSSGLGKLISGPSAFLSGTIGTGAYQQALTQADILKNGLTDEMAKYFKGTGSTDVNSIDSWGSTLNKFATPDQLKGTVQGGLDLFSGQLNAMLQQYQSTMGKPAEIGQILQPDTVAKLSQLKDEGYNVDVPGIKTTIGNQIDSAIANGYSSQDILTHLESNPKYSTQIKQAMDVGINADDIVSYLNQ